jgi:hypothetical protein
MKRLILTSHTVSDFTRSGFADLEVYIWFSFVSGPLPSPDELAAFLNARTPDMGHASHWSDWARWWAGDESGPGRSDLGLAEFCRQYETVELWFDIEVNSQLQLIWLLDHFRSHPEVVPRLKLRLVDLEMLGMRKLGKYPPPLVDVTEKELVTAGAAWQAYRAATPEACFALLGRDLSALPLLRPALSDLLDELPAMSTGLGATEMRMLEMIGRGYQRAMALFYLGSVRQTRIFKEFGHADLLDGLAFGPAPAVAGLDEELRTIRRDNYRDRLSAYNRSELKLTEFGKAIVARREDFSRHNPIHRWWGGTELTSDRLWRYGPVLTAPG